MNLSSYIAHRESLGLSKKTIIREHSIIRCFLRDIGAIDVRGIDRIAVDEYLARCSMERSERTKHLRSSETVRLYEVVLRTYFDWLRCNGKIMVSPLEARPVRKKRDVKLRPVFSKEDIMRFLDGIKPTGFIGLRDRTMYELMYASGLRFSEALALEWESVNLEERILLVKQGKGKKDRYVPFSVTARDWLVTYYRKAWKKLWTRTAKGLARMVFCTYRRRPQWQKTAARRFKRYTQAVDLAGCGYTAHSIRHATATHLLEAGAGIRYVQELLGHESVKTTQVYTRPGEENIKAAYRTYHPRENEHHREIGPEYEAGLTALRERLVRGRQASEQYQRLGHKKGFGGMRD